VRRGSEEDLDILSDMSRRLIQEQQYKEAMDLEQLRASMENLIRTGCEAYLFEVEGKPIGYSLVSRKIDPLSIVQFFILPEERGKGYGYQAVWLLQGATKANSIDVDARVWRAAAGAM